MLRRIPIAVLSLACLAPALAAPSDAPARPTVVEIPVGAPVTLDGLVPSGEWGDAARCPTSAGGPEIRMLQARGTWILALGTASRWPTDGHLTIYARAEPVLDEGELAKLSDEERAKARAEAAGRDRSILAAGTAWIDVEPREHNRPHVLVRVRDEAGAQWVEKPGSVVARFADVNRRASVEAAIPLSLLGVVRPKKPWKQEMPPLRWFAILTSPGGDVNYRTFPFPLDLAGNDAARLGPDLASSERWATSTAWVMADGPGAYSPTEWAALVRADAELTRMGTTAHGLALALDGASVDGTSASREKVDAPVEKDLLENLRAIARLEPLTHADVRAAARGLLELNRAPEAAALVESMTWMRDGTGEADDFDMLARASLACERFDDAAGAYDAMAERVAPRAAPGFRGTATWVRSVGAAWAEEQQAREADAKKTDLPLARLRTSKGAVYLRLLEDDVPQAVNQFVHLAEEAKAEDGGPFYAGTLFHHAAAGFLAEGGDPDSRKGCAAAGKGGTSWGVAPEVNARHRCFRGAVAFALGDAGDVRSRFFVMTGPKPDYHKTGMPVFATVVTGMDVVDRLEACDTLLGVDILSKRPHPYVPKKKT